jgi:pimeloyl-ACP methyl ester carboxylesterase
MQRVNLNGVDLEYDVQGSGEPLLLIHRSILADAFFPLLAEPRIANNYRVISYHRRGFAGSARARDPFTIGQQAADSRALLRGSYWIPGSFETSSSMSEPSNALPRFRTL